MSPKLGHWAALALNARWLLNNLSVPCQCSVEVVINLHRCCAVVCLHYTIVSPRYLRGGILRTQKSILSIENRIVSKVSHATNDIYISVRLSTRNTRKYSKLWRESNVMKTNKRDRFLTAFSLTASVFIASYPLTELRWNPRTNCFYRFKVSLPMKSFYPECSLL